MKVEGIERFVLRFVRAAEADEVGRHHSRVLEKGRDHAAIEIGPGRFAMQAQECALGVALLDVMRPKTLPFEVARRVRTSRETVEAFVGSTHGAIVEWT